eukprot:COSAG06_NODE_5462_length_3466_cov_2.305019_2_plen_199_part_00
MAMEDKLAVLTTGLQKQAGKKSSRRLEDAIANLQSLERQSAIMQSPMIHRSPSPRRPAAATGGTPGSATRHDAEGLVSMRQRLAEMEERARERTRRQQQQPMTPMTPMTPPQQQQRDLTVSSTKRPDAEQSAEMQAAKQAMLSALCAGADTSSEELEQAVSALKKLVDEADSRDSPGVAEATVMLGAARTQLRRLQSS